MAPEKTAAKFGFDVILIALREGALSPRDRVGEVRTAMLSHLKQLGTDHEVLGRIEYLRDLESLWYARAELWTVVANAQGKRRATASPAEITALFGDRVPDGMKPGNKNAVERERRRRPSISSDHATDLMPLEPGKKEKLSWGAAGTLAQE